MPAATCRLLPWSVAAGPHHMAADQTLLESAAAGLASLRFYGWSEATLSLGYFQPERLRHDDPLLAALPFVRRPSGGSTLVHHREVTYALALPAGRPWQSGEPWLPRMHGILAAALARLGVTANPVAPGAERHFEGPLCFRHFTAGDLLIGEAKVVGSAQRKLRGALMQHGAILLEQSPHTPSLPGIRELTGRRLAAEEVAAAVAEELARQTGWDLAPGEWTAGEQRRVEELVATRYGQDAWNRKR
ncbi:MAG TPA: lipoate--protein ligase family protein [Gemmataceae bacterium]|nr:lipoate--protein ligase family protein [Gemmataceae bacterium]